MLSVVELIIISFNKLSDLFIINSDLKKLKTYKFKEVRIHIQTFSISLSLIMISYLTNFLYIFKYVVYLCSILYKICNNNFINICYVA